MKTIHRHYSTAAIALGSAALLAVGITLMTSTAAQGQAAYGSYVGLGLGLGLIEGEPEPSPGFSIDFPDVGGVVAARYRLVGVPASLRAQVFIAEDGFAVVPTASYDVLISRQLHAYLGAGLAFVDEGNEGSETSFALQPGLDVFIPNSKLVLFGNAVMALDEDMTTSLQGGMGLRF